MQPKVTFIISSLRGGGAEGVCVTLANAFAARNWSVELVVLNLDQAVVHVKLAQSVRIIVLEHRHARSAFWSLWRYIHDAKPTNVVVFNHQLASLLVIVRRFSRRGFRLVARNISTLSAKRVNEASIWHKYFVALFVRLLYRRVDLVIAQSEGMRDDLLSNYGFRSDQVIVIHNPVRKEIETYSGGRNATLETTPGYLLCVGRLAPVKAFDYAIRAFALIADDCPGTRLKLVGSGPLDGYLRKVAEIERVSSRVDFEGYRDDLAALYYSAAATVLTSLYEGFPNVLVESLTLGTPAVAFDCDSGPNEIIVHDMNGFLVPYQDVESLATHMRIAVKRNWDREAIRKSALRYRADFVVTEYEKAVKPC